MQSEIPTLGEILGLFSNVESALEKHLPAIDAATLDADRAGVPLAAAGFLLVALDSPLAPAILAALGITSPVDGRHFGLALLRAEIEAVAVGAFGESAPHIVEAIRQAPRVDDGIGCFIVDGDDVMFAPVSRAPHRLTMN